jgi:hypothetical protein
LDEFEFESARRNDARLETAFGSDKNDSKLRQESAKGFSDGDQGVNVTTGSTSG